MADGGETPVVPTVTTIVVEPRALRPLSIDTAGAAAAAAADEFARTDSAVLSPTNRQFDADGHTVLPVDHQLSNELSFLPLPIHWAEAYDASAHGRWYPTLLPLLRGTILACIVLVGFVNIPVGDSASPIIRSGSLSFAEIVRREWVYIFFFLPSIGVGCALTLTEGSSHLLKKMSSTSHGAAVLKTDLSVVQSWSRTDSIQYRVKCFVGFAVGFQLCGLIVLGLSGGHFPLFGLVLWVPLVVALVVMQRTLLPPAFVASLDYRQFMLGANVATLSYPLFGSFLYGYAVLDSVLLRGILLVLSGLLQAVYRVLFQYPWKTRPLLADRMLRPTLYLFVVGHMSSYLSLPTSDSILPFIIQFLVSTSTLLVQPYTLCRGAHARKVRIESWLGISSDSYPIHVQRYATSFFMTLFAGCIAAVVFVVVACAVRFGTNSHEFPGLDPDRITDSQFWTTIGFAALQFVAHAIAIVIGRCAIDRWLSIDSFACVYYCLRDVTFHLIALLLIPGTLVPLLFVSVHSRIASQP